MLEIQLLEESYAVAAGTNILANVAEFGELPAEISGDYYRFKGAQQALQSARAGNARARTLDPVLDRMVTLPAKICTHIIEAYDSIPDPSKETTQRLEDARQIRSEYADDLRELVNIAYVEEWFGVGRMLARLTTPPLRSSIDRLALSTDIETAQALHQAYGEALGIAVRSSADDTPDLLAQWRNALCELLVVARFLERTHEGLYSLFAEPYGEQLAQQQSVRRTQRRRLRKRQAAAEGIE